VAAALLGAEVLAAAVVGRVGRGGLRRCERERLQELLDVRV
jgi:hypothetical protein